MLNNVLANLVMIASAVCLVLALLSLRDPKFAYLAKTKTKITGFISWICLAVLLFMLMVWIVPKDEYGEVIKPERQGSATVEPTVGVIFEEPKTPN